MASYSMVGNGAFGGSNNFLALLGGLGEDTVHGINTGMSFANNLLNYQNRLAVNPSAVQAAIADNISKQGLSTGQHYENYMRNQALSYLAAGGDPTRKDTPFFSLFGNSMVDRLRGTPNLGNTPAYTQQPLNPVNTSGTTNTVPQQQQSVIHNPETKQNGW